jgi:sugar-specific transcriptional regulator TrmB
MLEELMEKESERKKSSTEITLINANTKLMDKLKWIKEDIEKEMYKLSQYDDELIHEIIDDLEKIIKNNI